MTVDAGDLSPPIGARIGSDSRALFNPAFLASLIGAAAAAHRTDHEAPLPLALGYLVAPMILHPPTRQALPRRVNARLAIWADENQLLRAELRWRAPQLTAVTRRALRFGIRHDLLLLSRNGIGDGARIARLPTPREGEAAECWAAAELLGRWLPRAGPSTTVLALLGVRP